MIIKRLIILIIALFCTLSSCKQNNNNRLNSSISIDKIIQRFDEITEYYYHIEIITKGPLPGSIDSVRGTCTFIRNQTDTLIGAHYLLCYENGLTQLYNGEIFARANVENKSAVIYKLNEYPEPRRRVTSNILYFLSLNDIMNNLKEKLKNKPNSIIMLNDTIIDNHSNLRMKIVMQDTTIKGNHNEAYTVLIFDKSSLLPLLATFKVRNQGEVYEEQTTESHFSGFKISTAPTKKSFDVSSIPFQIEKLTYASDQPTLTALKIMDMAPEWKGLLTSGDSISSRDQFGKITLLNFTSVNCGFCLKANEVLNKIDDKYRNKQITVISVYPIDKIDNIKYLTAKSNIRHSIIYNASKMQRDYMVYGFPNLFLINQTGKIAYVSLMFRDSLEKELTGAIDKLLIDHNHN